MLNATELQTLLTEVLQSDSNADHVLSPQELELLMLRMSSFSVVDEAKLREAFKRAASTSASTTTLFHAAAASQSFAEDGDITFGYGEWLFEEAD